ncbi:MAG: AI-2E family transporter [Planctomycetota bacterium]|jgi:predicted PurR-regulated permease PerM
MDRHEGGSTGISFTQHARSGAQILMTLAALVIVIAGLKAAQDLLIPLLLGAFLAVVCVPPMTRLTNRGVPTTVAICIVVLAVMVLLAGVTTVLGNSVAQFSASVDSYQERITEILDGTMGWLEKIGVQTSGKQLSEMIDTKELLALVSDTLSQLLSALSSVVLILIIVIFMLFEAMVLPGKLRLIHGDHDADLTEYTSVANRIYQYVHLKTVISLVTGLLVAVFTAIVGIDFPLLWGLVAFLFNFIPNIGSILAAIPPMIMALIQFGIGSAAVVAGGYALINLVIGQLLEPRMMGRRMGLSPAVVIISLIFWNWVLGPIGMLLSIPLTMVVKILLEHSEDLKAVAVLLGNEGIEDQPASRPT